MLVATRQLADVADILELVAEYACESVRVAAELRRVSTGHRRAVDTTVRRLLYADQPQLRLSPEAPLLLSRRVHARAEFEREITTVCAALATSPFVSIARLVVVAFALDGAKDEAHEASACGPRPIGFTLDTPGGPPGTFLIQCPPRAHPTKSLGRLRLEMAVSQCLTEVNVDADLLNCNSILEVIEATDRPWRRVSRLTIVAAVPPDDGGRAYVGCGLVPSSLARVLRAIGPQLTHLCLRGGLPSCLLPSRSAAIADAIIENGATLTHLDLTGMRDEDVARLLEGVPTVVDVHVSTLACPETLVAALSPAAVGRMVSINGRRWGYRPS
jgi:hypothetical protein